VVSALVEGFLLWASAVIGYPLWSMMNPS